MRAIFATVVFTGAALAAGCSNKAIDPPAQAAAAPADAGKIPITTSADGARQEFLEGRSLAERLRVTDSIAHFDKAIALDPSFGLAELARANASPTGTEFLAHLAKAVAAADRLSDGEKLQIRGRQRGRQRQGARAAPPARTARRRVPAGRARALRARRGAVWPAGSGRRRSSTSSTPTRSRRTTRRRTTRWDTPTGSWVISRTPSRRSRSTSSSSRTIRTRTTATPSCC